MNRVVLLVPSYNSSTTIGATIKSVLSQDAPSLRRITELLLADDCSQDYTVEVAQSNWDPTLSLKIRVTRNNSNLGQWQNVNQAITSLEGTTDWVLLLHADDLAKPHWLSRMIDRIDTCSHQVASVCSSWDDLQTDESVIPGEEAPTRSVEVIPGNRSALRSTLLRGCWWHISGCAIRMEAFRQVGAFDQGMPQSADYEWLLRCLTAGWAVEYIPRTLILYRLHATSVSSQSFQLDRDVREKLPVLRRYRTFLSARDWTDIHRKLFQWQLRRIARAALTFRFRRLACAFRTLTLVLQNALSLRAS